MKFEFVEFYPFSKKNVHKSGWTRLGTVHIYLIDYEIDIRGIMVIQKGKHFRFNFPHFQDFESKDGNVIKYPHFRFVNTAKQLALMDFLHKEVLKIVKNRLQVNLEK